MTEQQCKNFILLVKEKLMIPNSYFYRNISDEKSLQLYRSNFSRWLVGERNLNENQLANVKKRCLELMKIIDFIYQD